MLKVHGRLEAGENCKRMVWPGRGCLGAVALLLCTVAVARGAAIDYDYLRLALPVVGDHTLHVLSPTLLELKRLNSKPAGVAPVDSWNFVDTNNVFQAPALSQFVVTVNGAPVAVTGVGFKRRPFYAPEQVRDLRIDNSLYLQLAVPVVDGQIVVVTNPGAALWAASDSYTLTVDPLRYSPAIHVNQEGYVPGLPKKAMIGYYLGSLGEMDVPPGLGFKLVTAGTNTVVFTGTLTPRLDEGYLSTPTPYQKVLEADFTSFTTPGRYQLQVPGLGASLPFAIDEGTAMNFLRTYALGLYHQRCGADNVLPFTRFGHDFCHMAPADVPVPEGSFAFTWATIGTKNADYASNPRHTAPRLNSPAAQLYPFVNTGKVDVSGGHHDAGDYSKYTINVAGLTHLLMFTADAIPGAAALDNLGVPESGDGLGDILQEAKREADYLAKLQDADGGFYFIVYPRDFEYEAGVLPDHGASQVVWPKNTAATAAGVAALAQVASSPRFKAAYPTLAALYLRKAKLGWQFLLNAIAAHGKDGSYQKITFYGDTYMHDDELAWAACELFVATGDPQYQAKLLEWFPNPADPTTFRFGWWRMSEAWGNTIRSYAFAVRSGRLLAGQLDAAYLALCEAQIVAAGDDALRWSNQNAYATSFPEETKRFLSGGWYFSLDQASDMAVAHQVLPKAAYLDALTGNMNFEGGTNPVNVTFVTGLGQKRQREAVSQYAQSDHRVLPPSGLPLGNIQSSLPFLARYGAELSALVFPSDGAVIAPYEFYDRWADTFNLTQEYVVLNQARGLLSLSVLASLTATPSQSWRAGTAQISPPSSVVLLDAPVTLSVAAPGFDLTTARIVWEARDQEPAFGLTYTISPRNNGPQWVEAEIALPDGRRVFAVSSFNANSTVVDWVDGAVPAGGQTNASGGDAWTWVAPGTPPPSGNPLVHQTNIAAPGAEHYHYFEGATATLHVGVGDGMFAWVYLDPANPPQEILLTWNNPGTEHRAYWGANILPWGVNGTAGRFFAGPLPPTGQWVRLSVPASAVELEGSTLSGMNFVLVGGRAWWDTAGVNTAVEPATAPVIAAPPLAQVSTIGSGATFTVAPTGTAPFSYQWFGNGAPLPGATGATLTLPSLVAADAGNYAVVVTNIVGSVTSGTATLTVNPGPGAPVISLHPQTQAVAAGADVTFTVAATGTEPLAYQWKRNGVPLVDATSTSYTITGAQPVRDNGWYQAVVTNASGATVSAAAFVNVAVSPTQIVGWGSNAEGETTLPAGLDDAVGLAAGGAHAVALKADGGVIAWGRNVEGQATVPGGLGSVVAVAAGVAHTVGLRSDGTVVAWGSNLYGQTAVPVGLAGVVSIAAGNYHSLALKGDGTVVAWGDNGSGQSSVPGGLVGVIGLAAGGDHSLALQSDGTVVGWGFNGTGQTAVPGANGGFVSVAAGDYHSAAVKSDGSVVAWGWNAYGQVTVPVGSTSVAALAAGGTHTIAQQTNGQVVAWGDGAFGQASVPGTLSSVIRLAAGRNFSLALRDARVLPAFASQPAPLTFVAGQTVARSVTATGVPAPVLQWRKNGTAIPGATGATLTLTNAQAIDAGTYDVIGTNSLGSVPSAVATLTVAIPPAVETAPAARTVVAGQGTTFAVVATGVPAPSFQWEKGGTPIAGATAASYTIDPVVPADEGSYRVVLTNLAGSVASSPAVLTVIVAPVITVQPVAVTANAGSSASFTVTATGTPAPVYQWRKGVTPIADATAATLALVNVQPADEATYRVTVSNAAGSVESAAVALTVISPPVIVTHPVDQLATVGQTATFSVVASGTAPLTYQWRKDDAPLAGATATNLVLPGVQATSAAVYSVVVSNAAGNVTSHDAALAVVDVHASHQASGGGYVAGGTVTIGNTLTYTGALTGLGWSVLLPAGWTYASGTGEGDLKPTVGDSNLLEWNWTAIPASPVTFGYTLNVPAGTTGTMTLAALVLPRKASAQFQALVSPDPLSMEQVVHHSADTNRDFKLGLGELLRVIELYNTRNDTVRTGAYAVEGTNLEDGFAADPARSQSAVVVLTRYHSADSNQDGKLGLTELLRVIELYNQRTGTVRTGEYHAQAGTEDSFAPGP